MLPTHAHVPHVIPLNALLTKIVYPCMCGGGVVVVVVCVCVCVCVNVRVRVRESGLEMQWPASIEKGNSRHGSARGCGGAGAELYGGRLAPLKCKVGCAE